MNRALPGATLQDVRRGTNLTQRSYSSGLRFGNSFGFVIGHIRDSLNTFYAFFTVAAAY
jgi:hypothetical protein